MVVYDEIAPKNILTGYIDNYWFCENLRATQCEYVILPDCCMDIVFDFTTKTVSICGAMSVAKTIQIKPYQKMFGIRFSPGVFPAMTGVHAARLQDAVSNLGDIDDKLAMALSDLFTIDCNRSSLADLCDRTLTPRLLAIDRQTMLSLNKLPIDWSVKRLSQHLKTSVRQTERTFAKYIGITPKRFLQIKRFSSAYRSLQQEQSSQVDISVTCGYFDQAHMHKEHLLLTNNRPGSRIMSSFYNSRVS